MTIDLHTCGSNAAQEHLEAIVQRLAKMTVLPLAQEDDPEETGGVFAMYRWHPTAERYLPVFEIIVGDLEEQQVERYRGFANEKAERLGAHPDHVSSWQSRDEGKRQYGGAIKCGDDNKILLTFSGLAEVFDELLNALAAQQADIITQTQMRAIADASENPHLRKLLGE